MKEGGTSKKEVGGAGFAGSSPPCRGRERAAVDVDVGPERRSHDSNLSFSFFAKFWRDLLFAAALFLFLLAPTRGTGARSQWT